MCLAFPGKIIKIDKNNKDLAIVDFDGLKKETNISLVDVQKNDHVIVHAGFAIQKLSGQDALDTFKLYEESERNKRSNKGNKRTCVSNRF